MTKKKRGPGRPPKFDGATAQRIRKQYDGGETSLARLAKQYGVGKGLIIHVVNGYGAYARQ